MAARLRILEEAERTGQMSSAERIVERFNLGASAICGEARLYSAGAEFGAFVSTVVQERDNVKALDDADLEQVFQAAAQSFRSRVAHQYKEDAFYVVQTNEGWEQLVEKIAQERLTHQ